MLCNLFAKYFNLKQLLAWYIILKNFVLIIPKNSFLLILKFT